MTPGEYTLAHGGGTFGRDGIAVTPTSGYAVGVAVGTYERISPNPDAADIDMVWRHVAAEYPDAPYIGTWRASDDGYVHVDPVTILADRDAAILLGRTFRQVAIWDFTDGTEVTL